MYLEPRSDHSAALVAVIAGVEPVDAAVPNTAAFLNLPAPRLPHHRAATRALTASLSLHAAAAILLIFMAAGSVSESRSQAAKAIAVRHVVFLARPGPDGGGGGGGGKREPAPASRASSVGRDRLTVPVARPIVGDTKPLYEPPPLPAIALDAVPLASGIGIQIGLPDGDPGVTPSQGPGTGGGAGDGVGTGIGPGRGPGLGPGSGGGTGGGVYRPGNGVSAPVLLKEVKPTYTADALRNQVQGSVVLEIVVRDDGVVGDIRKLRSLDPGGLDEQAILAVRQWQFRPGRRAGLPVNVLVTVIVDFSVR